MAVKLLGVGHSTEQFKVVYQTDEDLLLASHRQYANEGLDEALGNELKFCIHIQQVQVQVDEETL